MGHYSASKAALQALSDALRRARALPQLPEHVGAGPAAAVARRVVGAAAPPLRRCAPPRPNRGAQAARPRAAQG